MGARCEITHKHLIPGCPYCAVDEALAEVEELRAELGEMVRQVRMLEIERAGMLHRLARYDTKGAE